MTTDDTTAPAGAAGPGPEPAPDWWVYRCVPDPHDGISRLPAAPPWRSFADDDRTDLLDPPEPGPVGAERRRLGRNLQASVYQADREEIHLVNMALLLRRPLLVTGPPGVGKSTLAYSIARELGLGPVLRWSVTSRTTLQEGQYQYDAIGRLQDGRFTAGGLMDGADGVGDAADLVSANPTAGDADGTAGAAGPSDRRPRREPPDIGRYLRLGPLGTALLPWRVPRVLLVDEIDKSDADFPNDLLHVFEEGEFTVLELARLRQPTATVMTADDDGWVRLGGGRVRCHEFPVVVMTSNGERDFPPAFLRRCVRLEIRRPDRAKLARLLDAHLPPADGPSAEVRRDLIERFLDKQDQDGAELANDQLLNAVRAAQHIWAGPEERALIGDHLLRPLNEG